MECPEIDAKLEIDAKGDKLENGEEGAKKLNELNIINESLKVCIDGFRRGMYLTLDQCNFKFISVLRGVEEVSYFEDLRRDKIVFVLPLTPLTTKIFVSLNRN